ncbi:MAG: glycosyltransferase family A protein, partial [Thermoanaerobaculia bacterium]|nr:glycosyltransferase family A protein [Thermoanaerobaculia bacterium]
MRIIALLATYNEERFIVPCLEHFFRHGVEVYLIDNESKDRTVSLARQYLGRGLVGLETLPRGGVYEWEPILERKEQLADELDADWFMHADADEIRLPPPSFRTLAQAFTAVDRQGFNAVNFLEFTFVPTRQRPNH